MSGVKDGSSERMRFLLYETNEIPTQKLWNDEEEELEPLAKKKSSTPCWLHLTWWKVSKNF